MIIIDEERVGEGQELAFPNISSCAAVIAVVENTLVGAHFVADQAGTLERTAKLAERMRTRIGTREVRHLLIIGYNNNHNPARIRDFLQIAPNTVAKAYDIGQEKARAVGRKKVDYAFSLFATANGDECPNIEFKREAKVGYTKRDGWFALWKQRDGYEGTATAANLHGLRRHYENL